MHCFVMVYSFCVFLVQLLHHFYLLIMFAVNTSYGPLLQFLTARCELEEDHSRPRPTDISDKVGDEESQSPSIAGKTKRFCHSSASSFSRV